jgi:hypothetical protein
MLQVLVVYERLADPQLTGGGADKLLGEAGPHGDSVLGDDEATMLNSLVLAAESDRIENGQ